MGPVPGCQGCQFFELMKSDGPATSYDLTQAGFTSDPFLPASALTPTHRTHAPDCGWDSKSCHSFTQRVLESHPGCLGSCTTIEPDAVDFDKSQGMAHVLRITPQETLQEKLGWL